MSAWIPHIIDISIAIMIFFVIICFAKGTLQVIQKLYLTAVICLIFWMAGIIGMYYVPDTNQKMLIFYDAITCSACALMVVTMLLISIAFSKNYVKLPKRWFLLYLLPVVTSIIVFTNPMHHLFYKNFSIYASEVTFGPLFLMSGLQYYIYSLSAIFIMLMCGLKNRQKMTFWQCMLFVIGLLPPLIVNMLATLKIGDWSIAATPIAFLFTMICHGIAIGYLNFLNIKPIALQNILDNISDGYVIISSDSYIINYNQPFYEIFGEDYGIKTNVYLNKIVDSLEERKKDAIYNLLNFFDVCKQSVSVITYEQAILSAQGKFYYSVELTPVFFKSKLVGIVALFKDVTQLKEEMRREQQTLARAMERERLISLGQMIGGISHNLKTPIMSISGDAASLGNLVREYRESIGDSEVTTEDHIEISDEMASWIRKIKECCAYMSDIITTVKGLAVNMNASEIADFSIDEVFKRVQLLMKSTLMKKKCELIVDNQTPVEIGLKGDVNNLVQVVGNLADNAGDAMPDGGKIVLKSWVENKKVYITVTDNGTGLSEEAKDKVFTTMFTTKGTKGTGLGLYSSAGLIRGKFDGDMWVEDNPEGGAIFGFCVPIAENN